jgi:hypothetical protein
MSGAVWVRDQLSLAGWEMEVAHARKVRDVAPLACKTDKVDARAVEAANQAWRSSNPFHAHYLRIASKHGKNPAKSAVARKLLITTWHMLSRGEVFRPAAQMAAP